MKLPIILGLASLLVVIGVGLYVTDFTAYLGNNPTTCNNCHVMDAAYEGWYHGDHKLWANCGECHTPHALIPKYYVKALSGYHHVTAFVFGDIPKAIRAKETSRAVVQENCVRCHAETVASLLESSMAFERYCFDCHRSSAHGERGLSLLPYQHSEEN
ncbi:MAG: cytochrome c nitrite reductase small subunit [Anaerolineales bacterium]|nr:MAG: cytochrome c nitrite reductase small subunit [Anaerolineales bacterium]